VHVVPVVLAAFFAVTQAHADPPGGTIEVETTGATAHDRARFVAIARELEQHEDLWSAAPPRGTKTFRLKTYARGGVRGLTELDASVRNLVACKLLRNRLWRLKLRSTAPRTVVVTFRFRPKPP
jgi:hypothetical protein